MSELERQLTISIELAHCSPDLRAFVKDLQRQLGKARLLADLRQDLAAFDISADSIPEVSIFHRRQI